MTDRIEAIWCISYGDAMHTVLVATMELKPNLSPELVNDEQRKRVKKCGKCDQNVCVLKLNSTHIYGLL